MLELLYPHVVYVRERRVHPLPGWFFSLAMLAMAEHFLHLGQMAHPVSAFMAALLCIALAFRRTSAKILLILVSNAVDWTRARIRGPSDW